MIHHSSTDPVLIKKISLKVWTLRDEVECRVREKLESTPEAERDHLDLSDIKNAYTAKSLDPNIGAVNNVVELKTGADLDTSEDEMMKAMQEASSDEAPSEEAPSEEAPSEEAPSEEALNAETANEAAAENVTSLFGGDSPNPSKSEDSNLINISASMPPLPEDKIFKGKTVLAEIGMDKIYFFSNKKFTEGQSIVIKFEIPKTFIMNADVLYCRPFNLKSRVISENNYQFRVMAKFNFLKEGERALLRQFLKSVEPEVQAQPVSTETIKSEKTEDSDFSELDDLI